jgi:hypothetical protein
LKYLESRKFRTEEKKFVQALTPIIENKDENRLFALHYPNTCVENCTLEFEFACLALGPHCQGILFKDCTISGVLFKLCSLDLVK